jgi:hypothetical protein
MDPHASCFSACVAYSSQILRKYNTQIIAITTLFSSNSQRPTEAIATVHLKLSSMVVFNPYSRDNLAKEKATRIAREAAHQEKENQARTVTLLMNAQAREKKKDVEHEKDLTRKHRGKRSAKRRIENAVQKKLKYSILPEEQTARTARTGIQGTFQSTTLNVYDHLSKQLKNRVGFEETGAHNKFGKWPHSFLGPKIDPQSDPVNFFGSEGLLGMDIDAPKQELFACRPIMF